MEGDLILKQCCGKAFGHSPNCYNYRTAEKARAASVTIASLQAEIESLQSQLQAEREMREAEQAAHHHYYMLHLGEHSTVDCDYCMEPVPDPKESTTSAEGESQDSN